jgi:hypothetical protein
MIGHPSIKFVVQALHETTLPRQGFMRLNGVALPGWNICTLPNWELNGVPYV